MAVKVVVELKTKPGKRDELKCLFETLMAEIGPSLTERLIGQCALRGAR